MEENLKKALSELLVLALLHERDHHVQEMTAAILERSGGAISLTGDGGSISELLRRAGPTSRRFCPSIGPLPQG